MARLLSYSFDEAIAGLRRTVRSAFTAVLTIAVAFLVLGAFLIVTGNTERVLARLSEAAEFSVYLRDDVSDADRSAIEGAVRGSGMVADLELVSKEEARRRFRESFSPMADIAEGLPSNPLPASIEAQLARDADAARVSALAERLTAMPGVADVRFDRQWIHRLTQIVGIVRLVGIVLTSLLMCAAALTVASVVRLALSTRRDEIHIMQLVGAPGAYVRGPFVMEGIIQGGVGAALAIVLLFVSFFAIRGGVEEGLGDIARVAAPAFLSMQTIVALLLGGLAVGAAGGLIAARATREVAD